MMQVKGAAYGVFKKMGGKESEKVGVLLFNIYASSKLRGVYDQRSDWVKELKDQSSVTAEKVKTDKNLADLYTKCHAAAVRTRLQQELEALANKIARKSEANKAAELVKT